MKKKKTKITNAQGKLLLKKYNRLKVEDSALAMFREEVRIINESFFDKLDDNKIHYSIGGEYERELNVAFNRLNDKSLIKNWDFRELSNKARYATYQQRHGKKTLQQYINEIEKFNAFRDINGFMADLNSEEIKEYYDIGKDNNLSEEEVRRRIEHVYDESFDTTISRVKEMFREELRKQKIDY